MRFGHPRLISLLIVALTACGGFLASYGLYRLGIYSLWLRYVLAVVFAYLAFLFLLRVWLVYQQDSGDNERSASSSPKVDESLGFNASNVLDPNSGNSSHQSSRRGYGRFDFALGFNSEEFGILLLLTATLMVLFWATFSIILAVPSFVAELLISTAFAGGLYRRVRELKGVDWVRSALRSTVLPFLVIAVVFALSGAWMQWRVPQAKTIGQFLDGIKDGQP